MIGKQRFYLRVVIMTVIMIVIAIVIIRCFAVVVDVIINFSFHNLFCCY